MWLKAIRLFGTFFALSIPTDSPSYAEPPTETFQSALEAFNAGSFMEADRIFQTLTKDGQQTLPDVMYFAAKAAYQVARHKRAKNHIETYLALQTGPLLYEKEAIALKAAIDLAIKALSLSDQAGFEYAQTRGTIFAYAAYRDQYPDGDHVAASDFLSFRRAKELNVELAYLRYLEYWPAGAYRREAQRGADNAAYWVARKLNTASSYQIYLSDYPGGLNERDAKLRAEAQAFYKASKDGSVAALKRFLALYPNGSYAAEARKVLQKAEDNAPRRNLTGPTVVIRKGIYIHRKPPNTEVTNQQRVVEIPAPIVAMANEVTFEQWDLCVSEGGCNNYSPDDMGFGRGTRPVLNVSFNDIELFTGWFNKKWADVGGQGYWRLPSEVEWSYMANATNSYAAVLLSETEKNTIACPSCEDASTPIVTFPVGSYKPNSFGLYDMLGNVGEWVADCWHSNFTSRTTHHPYEDGEGNCSAGVIRGLPDQGRPAFLIMQHRQRALLNKRLPIVGFRLVNDQ